MKTKNASHGCSGSPASDVSTLQRFNASALCLLLPLGCLLLAIGSSPAAAPPAAEAAPQFAIFNSQFAIPNSLLQLAFPGVPASELGEARAKDYSPFTLNAAQTRGNPAAIDVTFSLAVDPATATNLANYTLTPSVSIIGAGLGASPNTVRLTTAALPDDTLHTLAASNIQDATLQYALPPNSQLPVLKAQGVITRQIFTGLTGAAVSNLTSAAKFPNAPDSVDWPASFEATANAADNYGLQFAGFVHPPVSGDYAFFMAADEQAALSLSPDENPANKVVT